MQLKNYHQKRKSFEKQPMPRTVMHVPNHLQKKGKQSWRASGNALVVPETSSFSPFVAGNLSSLKPYVEVQDRSPLCSKEYIKLNPQVTLCGSCFVMKLSSIPYNHFFLSSSKD